MKEITQFENRRLEIWRRPRQRTLNLRVRPDGALRVTCARGVPKREIFTFIREQREFIVRCLRQIEIHEAKFPPKKFATGEEFLVLGRRLPLQLVWSWAPKIRVAIDEDRIEMIAPLSSTRGERQQALFKAYKNLARAELSARVLKFSARMGLFPSALSIRGQTTRWGSCSAKGELSLNWKLMAVPEEVIDYVIMHELAHLKHLDHSPRFWRLVEGFCPDFEKHKRWLRENEPEIGVQFHK